MGRAAIPFWDHVVKGDGCWEWQGAHRGIGYGRAVVNRASVAAHRRAWELTYGPIPKGLYVRHRCDNPPCIRPEHLELGTQQDNINDAKRRGRRAVGLRHPSHLNPRLRQGENHGAHVLTETDVLNIRTLAANGFKRGDLTRLAEQYGVTKTSIWGVANGRSWRHLL
jgi:hypothetical protein